MWQLRRHPLLVVLMHVVTVASPCPVNFAGMVSVSQTFFFWSILSVVDVLPATAYAQDTTPKPPPKTT